MKGLFYIEEHKGKCKCAESNKPMSRRYYTYYAYFCHKPWGRAKDKYDNRKLLRITCNKCGATWVDYNPKSKYWDLLGDGPYKEGENVYTNKRGNIITKVKEFFRWI